ncbi:MAG: type II secretion system minor pseudopilin GspK [Thermodesulfovibrionales bacterium]|jgi:general secretion pathway protein K
MGVSNDQQGVALVVVLLALVLLTAMVVEFSYGVYTGTNDLYNWRDAQRLSVMAKSGVNVSANLLSNKDMVSQYTESIEMPIENPFEDFNGIITVRIEDEDAKFNLNAIIPVNLDKNDPNNPYNCFIRLLKALSLDVKIADCLVDWLHKKRESILSDSEVAAKNSALDSVDELLLINGISGKDYEKLLPYITVSTKRDNLIVNVNRAEAPVLMSLADGISEEKAKNVIQRRKGAPFTGKDIQEFQTITSTSLGLDRIRFDGAVFCIKSSASSGGVKRVIETVLDTTTNTNTVQYWKEY